MATNDQEAAIATVEREVLPIVERAQAIADGIMDPAGYNTAANYLIEVTKKKKLAVQILDPFRVVAFKAYQATLDEIKKWTDPLDRARAIVEPRAASWMREQERLRQEEQRRLEAIERKRQEDEQLRRAEAAAVAGDKDEADAILDQPVIPAPVVLPSAAPKVAGIAQVERWKAEVTNLMDLVVAIAQGRAPLAAVKPDMQVLDALARTQKAELRIPGVKPVAESGLRIGGRMSA